MLTSSYERASEKDRSVSVVTRTEAIPQKFKSAVSGVAGQP